MRLCHQCGAVATEGDKFCRSCGAAIDNSSSANDPLVGRTIGGNYLVQELVGVGGMGRVYRSEQSTLGRTVAIKVIHPHLLSDEQTVARFYGEARAASRLNHPNSVSIIDFGRTDDGILYLAMEFLKGKDLALVMHEEGPLPFPRICEILIGVLEALDEAHAFDIVHRDMKPENIILRRLQSGDDLVKVVDFGLATIVGNNSTSITRPGLVCGTPDYMPPEQARGEQVDGRGDLYALGVVLFELLTDQLPFDDETPTKVVLRHINDPVPDPREVAPHRGMPDSLAEICIRALQKDRNLRFANASEMRDAIREALETMRSTTSGVLQTVSCGSCGTQNPAEMRFCGKCGTRLGSKPATSSSRAPRTSFRPVSNVQRPFVGRVAELEALDEYRREALGRLVQVHVMGEMGVGKTRLLGEAAERFAAAGDLVVGAAPHPTGAPVPYGPLRELVALLLERKVEELEQVAAEGSILDPLSRAGLQELAEARGLEGYTERSRIGAVADAVAAAIRTGLARTGAARAVLVIDDIDKGDGLTQKVLAQLDESLGETSVLLLLGMGPTSRAEGNVIELAGLTLEQAAQFLKGDTAAVRPGASTVMPGRRLLPLYLEQLHSLGAQGLGDETMPPRLADAVAQRVDRVGIAARRVMQTVAAYGGNCELEVLRELVDPADMSGLEELSSAGLAIVSASTVDLTHPFIAELVAAFIPAEARKEVHARILALVTERGAPLEVRAEHAYRSGQPMRSLMTLERMGDTALRRGDTRAAVLAYRRALELARREMLESGDTVMDTALVTFSRKLGWAMARAGDLAGADGVVREAFDLTGRFSSARARMHVVLGRIATLRDRRRDAMRQFGQALEIVAGEDPEVESDVQLALGESRASDGDPAGAANAYRRALELLEGSSGDLTTRARVRLDLAEVLLAIGDADQCREQADTGRKLAEDAGAGALVARASGLLGRIAELAGDRETARGHYETAAARAASAGDALATRRWRDAVLLAS
ncbi:MAG: protein kinase [Deltaproteobacteria bacterium]|nr:protein kinase [Deltaproteobacteria bacterium]